MDLDTQIKDLESDLTEVLRLLDSSERKRVQNVIKQEQQKIEKELTQKRQLKEKQSKRDSTDTTVKGYTVKINNYGWDQSEKFVKIYITLKGVHKIPAENVEVTFTEKSFDLLVKDLDGKNHQMILKNLLCPIEVQESSRKVKTDMVLLMCKKTAAKKWDCLTQVEKNSKEKDKPNVDPNENADPSDGLMTMLKKIYTEGDDEMKRTITKAWTESQDKKTKGDEMDI
ncbi:calcyclin-binding protein isoform X1 [Clupea harengus]|uniref:Calcyclin-binding protein n=1 Tax=Clupea harengus TaxID=7950 RepID=A0A6P3VVA8_CLUHA|nr:calcyclin-binding protein isoform X1 [Clupea harengus]